ncbi:MAG: hypothetical protein FJZ01_01035 [Candidatus Sericytochromatia bacterium]|nr:hypothetical protein [Candidatus Tanganyikabacteria bacterium]
MASARDLPALPAPGQVLKRRVQQLLPEADFKSEPGARWSKADLSELLRVVKAMSPQDRKALGNVTFERTKEIGGAHGQEEFGEIDFRTRDGKPAPVIRLANRSSQERSLGATAAHEIGHAIQGRGF